MPNTLTNEKWVSLLQRISTTESLNSISTTKVTVKKSKFLDADSIITIPLEKLKEMHDNLIYNGFTDTEALVITAQVAANARATN